MRYWLLPVLLCIGGAQAQAGDFVSTQPGLLGVSFNNRVVSATAGVQFGKHNNLDVQQRSLVNVVGVQQVSLGKSGGSNSNTANVDQAGPYSYSGVGQAIETFPPFPHLGP